MKYQPSKQVRLDTIGNITLSTVLLPKIHEGQTDQWETCLFNEDGSGNSRVLFRYDSEEDAVERHNQLVLQEYGLQLDARELQLRKETNHD